MPVDKAVDIKGLTFVGQHDPTYNIFGGDRTSAQGHKTAEKTADKLFEAASDQRAKGKFVIALIHNPAIAAKTLENGAANTSLKGHTHKSAKPVLNKGERGQC